MEMLEQPECGRAFGLCNRRPEPTIAKQLSGEGLRSLASTVIEADFMNTMSVEEGETVRVSALWPDAGLADRMTKLNTQAETFESCRQEIVAGPFLNFSVSIPAYDQCPM